VSIRRPAARLLLGGALLGAGGLAVIGGLALGGPGLVGVGLAATLAGCTAAGIAREAPDRSRGSTLEAAVWAAGWTAGVVLVVAGVSTVAGGAVAAVVVLTALTVIALRWGRRQRGRTTAGGGSAQVVRLPVGPPPAGAAGDSRLLPVPALSTRALGEEWLRTTAALNGRLSTAARASLVGRREEALDELERRDPDGFARWLVAGPASDPADFVRGGPAPRGPVADTDAA
jgi:hypothetical protein